MTVIFWSVIQNRSHIFGQIILCVTDVWVFVYVFCDCWHNPIENLKTFLYLKRHKPQYEQVLTAFSLPTVKEAEVPLLF